MKIDKGTLMNALEIVKPGLASNELIEQSTSFAFMNGRVVTYNDEISISHPIADMDITGAIKAEELYKLLGKIKKDTIQIAITDTELRINAGKSKAGLTLQQTIKLPLEELGDLGKWRKIPEKLMLAIATTIFSCSTNSATPKMTCIHVTKEGEVESCDNYRLTQFHTGQKLPIASFLLPASSAKALIGYSVTHISEGQGWVHFKTAEDTIFSCRIFEDDYPDLTAPLTVEGISLQFPKSLKEVLDRAAVFAKREDTADDSVQVDLSADGTLKIGSKDITGWFEESTTIKGYAGDPISFTVNPTFLASLLSKDVPCVVSPNRIKFMGDDWEHVVALQATKS